MVKYTANPLRMLNRISGPMFLSVTRLRFTRSLTTPVVYNGFSLPATDAPPNSSKAQFISRSIVTQIQSREATPALELTSIARVLPREAVVTSARREIPVFTQNEAHRYWHRIPQWGDVSVQEFLSYQWTVRSLCYDAYFVCTS